MRETDRPAGSGGQPCQVRDVQPGREGTAGAQGAGLQGVEAVGSGEPRFHEAHSHRRWDYITTFSSALGPPTRSGGGPETLRSTSEPLSPPPTPSHPAACTALQLLECPSYSVLLENSYTPFKTHSGPFSGHVTLKHCGTPSLGALDKYIATGNDLQGDSRGCRQGWFASGSVLRAQGRVCRPQHPPGSGR